MNAQTSKLQTKSITGVQWGQEIPNHTVRHLSWKRGPLELNSGSLGWEFLVPIEYQ